MRTVLLKGKQRISRAKYWVYEHQGAYKYTTLLSYEGRRKVICFSHLNCLCTTKFSLQRTFSPVEAISLEIWEIKRSYHTKCSLPISVRVSKRVADVCFSLFSVRNFLDCQYSLELSIEQIAGIYFLKFLVCE